MPRSDPRSHVRLPANRAFVVQFAAEPAISDVFRGRAEHLSSGQVVNFESLDHLAAFLAQVLAGSDRGGPSGEEGA